MDEEHKLPQKEWDKNEVVKSYSSEENLLKTFLKYYLNVKPTIITGWNIDGFDIPYLYNRIYNTLGEDIENCLSPINHIYYNKYRERYMIGCELFGLLSAYIRILHSVPNQVIDWMILVNLRLVQIKISYEGTLNDLYENHLEKFIEYNIHDVRIVKKLDDKLDFIDVRGICHVGHVPYEDIQYDSRFLEDCLGLSEKTWSGSSNKPDRTEMGSNREKFGRICPRPTTRKTRLGL